MQIYRSKYNILPGSSLAEVLKAARREYHIIQKRTPRRQAHLRSRYFRKDKIFINQFWEHLKQKRSSDQMRRLRFYCCAIDLIRHSPEKPTIKLNPNNGEEALYRFMGATNSGEVFVVQIKENIRTKRKDFMSTFPFTLK